MYLRNKFYPIIRNSQTQTQLNNKILTPTYGLICGVSVLTGVEVADTTPVSFGVGVFESDGGFIGLFVTDGTTTFVTTGVGDFAMVVGTT